MRNKLRAAGTLRELLESYSGVTRELLLARLVKVHLLPSAVGVLPHARLLREGWHGIQEHQARVGRMGQETGSSLVWGYGAMARFRCDWDHG